MIRDNLSFGGVEDERVVDGEGIEYGVVDGFEEIGEIHLFRLPVFVEEIVVREIEIAANGELEGRRGNRKELVSDTIKKRLIRDFPPTKFLKESIHIFGLEASFCFEICCINFV